MKEELERRQKHAKRVREKYAEKRTDIQLRKRKGSYRRKLMMSSNVKP